MSPTSSMSEVHLRCDNCCGSRTLVLGVLILGHFQHVLERALILGTSGPIPKGTLVQVSL